MADGPFGQLLPNFAGGSRLVVADVRQRITSEVMVAKVSVAAVKRQTGVRGPCVSNMSAMCQPTRGSASVEHSHGSAMCQLQGSCTQGPCGSLVSAMCGPCVSQEGHVCSNKGHASAMCRPAGLCVSLPCVSHVSGKRAMCQPGVSQVSAMCQPKQPCVVSQTGHVSPNSHVSAMYHPKGLCVSHVPNHISHASVSLASASGQQQA